MILNLLGRWNGHRRQLLPKKRRIESKISELQSKRQLVVKQEHLEHAQDIFADTGIQITSTGRPYLGAAFGSTQGICCPVCREMD